MPFIGMGLHFLVALFFAVHAVRTGREIYWLLILFMFPLLGSIVYCFAIYLPSTRLQYTVQKTMTAAVKSLDPGRERREAQQAFDLTPTAQNQMRLANALLESGACAEAVARYEACLQGPFSRDPEVRLGAARAWLQNGQASEAVEVLQTLRKETPEYRAEQAALLLAQAYALAQRHAEARAEFSALVARYGSLEARAEFAIWALDIGDHDAATAQYEEIEQTMKHWNKHTRALNKPLISRLEKAFAAARTP